MAAQLKVIQEPTATGRVIDFEEVAHVLATVGKQAGRFATGVMYGYMPGYGNPNSPEASILYQVVIDAGDYTSLVVRAHEIAFSTWGIRATLHFIKDELLCAAWIFADGIVPRCATSPPCCVKCLETGCNDTCHADIDVGQVPVKLLSGQVVRWIRDNLPSTGFRSPQHQTGTLAA